MKINLLEAVEIFGDDAKSVLQEKIVDLNEQEESYQDLLDLKVSAAKRIFKYDDFTNWFLTRVLTLNVATRLSKIKKEAKKIKQALVLFKPNNSKDWDTKVEQARQLPVESLYPGNLKKTYRERMVGLCCFHKESNPSLTFYLETNSWFCYGCNIGGDVLDFIMQLEKLNFTSAVRRLAP